jgi:hypothetical protein
LAHCQKEKVEIMEDSQNRRFYGKMECLPLWPTYIPWGTQWEPDENLKGTCWEQRKNEPKSSPPPKLKRKKIKAL